MQARWLALSNDRPERQGPRCFGYMRRACSGRLRQADSAPCERDSVPPALCYVGLDRGLFLSRISIIGVVHGRRRARSAAVGTESGCPGLGHCPVWATLWPPVWPNFFRHRSNLVDCVPRFGRARPPNEASSTDVGPVSTVFGAESARNRPRVGELGRVEAISDVAGLST